VVVDLHRAIVGPATPTVAVEVDRQRTEADPDSVDVGQSTADALLEALVSNIHGVLGDDLVGIYLYGSYVSGGFDAGASDLDLVAVTSTEVVRIDLVGLEQVHQDIVRKDPEWSDRIECVYIGRAALRSFRTSPGPLAVISPGEPFHLRNDRPLEWLQNWYLIRQTGVALYGLPADAVIPPITRTEFVAATARYAKETAGRSLAGASPGSLAYAVLTMCRANRTVRTLSPGSKQEGAGWTRDRMPEWAGLIDAALRCRLSRGTYGFDDEPTRIAAERFIGLLAAEIERYWAAKGRPLVPD